MFLQSRDYIRSIRIAVRKKYAVVQGSPNAPRLSQLTLLFVYIPEASILYLASQQADRILQTSVDKSANLHAGKYLQVQTGSGSGPIFICIILEIPDCSKDAGPDCVRYC